MKKLLERLFRNHYKEKLQALLKGLGVKNIECFMDNAKPDDYRKYGETFKRKD